MNFDYAKDSKEQRPYEHYLEAYKDLDPEEISERTGFPYDKEKGLFTVHLMGTTYLVSFPDYEIHHEEDSIGVYPLEEAMNAKILIVRYMAERHAAPSSGKLSLIMKFHGERCISDSFRADALHVWRFLTETSWKCFKRSWNIWEQKKHRKVIVPINWNLWTIFS